MSEHKSQSLSQWQSKFLQGEVASGIILMLTAVAALCLYNSPWALYYDMLLATPLSVHVGSLGLTKPLMLWVNDGLMAVFFFLIGLELKREVIEGELNSLEKSLLPILAAAGGVIAPAFIYLYTNEYNATLSLKGWAIPTATDIAFALGIITIVGSHVPKSLKVFLTALAIIDDLAAIIIIAIFYTPQLSWFSAGFAVICLCVLTILNRAHVVRFAPYLIVGVCLWLAVLKSGVHATLAGFALAMAIPISDPGDPSNSPSKRLEKSLFPWVAFGVLPLFAFVNAGFSLGGMTLSVLTSPIPLGIALGLFLGKQIGVFGMSWMAVKCGIARLPTNASWLGLYGAALLCGVGFTMSLFIGGLAFQGEGIYYETLVRVGVMMGSIASGVAGYLILRFGRCSQQTQN